jgi:hypothetical protein
LGTHLSGEAHVIDPSYAQSTPLLSITILIFGLDRGAVRGTLQSFIASNPERVLGPRSIEHFGATLPYLLKVLSIAQPLSLQAHPDITLARELHSQFPNIYKGRTSFHKPIVQLFVEK